MLQTSVPLAFFASLPLSLALFFYKRALVPIYGTVPTNTYLDHVVLGAAVLVATRSYFFSVGSKTPYTAWLAGSALLFVAPKALYWIPVLTARKHDPVVGPIATHLITLAPLVAAHVLPALACTSGVESLICATLIYVSSQRTKDYWERISYLNSVSENQLFFTLSAVWLLVYIYSIPLSASSKSKATKGTKKRSARVEPSTGFPPFAIKSSLFATFLAGLFVTYPILKSPVLPHPLKSTYTHPEYPIQIHSSVQSMTGLIVVGEGLAPPKDGSHKLKTQMHSVRYLRAAHSILGGVWTGQNVQVLDNIPPLVDSHGTQLGDSIYGVFALQEAARFGGVTEPKNALIIGLGVGISATSLMRHGISTSIIEIDPAVYDAARTWFGLPDPVALGGQVYLEDARGWVKNAASNRNSTRYDIVIHDCFSGGGVPEQLYTVEFWKDLKTVLSKNGILVVNFVGRVDSPSSRMMISTLEKTVGRCRAFHDVFDDLPVEKYKTEFLNMVFFCSTSPQAPIFRASQPSDWLGSPLRRHVLKDLTAREIDLDLIRTQDDGLLLTDANNSLNKMQEEQGGFHWKLMRGVLEDIFWEVY